MTNHCGECNACCKVFAIGGLKKAGEWCKHCDIGKSCRIYDTRPEACVGFECLWLQSQKENSPQKRLADNLRPDKCKVLFSGTTNERVISAIPMAPNAMESTRVKGLIDIMLEGGFVVTEGLPGKLETTLHYPGGTKQVKMSEPDEQGMQWSEKNITYEY